MLSDRELSAAIGSTAYGTDGAKIGTVEHFFVDDRTGQPTWVAVTTGLFGTRHSIVPALEASFTDGSLQLPVTRDAVRSAPSVDPGHHLDPEEEDVLRRHYTGAASGTAAEGTTNAERPTAEGTTDAGDTTAQDTTARDDTTQRITTPYAGQGTAGQGTAAQGTTAESTTAESTTAESTTNAAGTRDDGAMTRSEERLRVGTEEVRATRLRVVKYVVTEEVQLTVPVRREEIRVEEVPLDAPDPGPGESLVDQGRHAAPEGGAGGGAGAPGADAGGLPDEIVLHREEPVVSVRVVPVERVRLRTEQVAGQEQVSGQVLRERITVDQEPAARDAVDRDATTRQQQAPRPDAG